MKHILSAALFAISINASAQSDTTITKKSPIAISAYVEAYYSYDFNKPSNNTKAPFLYSHNRQNEFTVNLAYVKAVYNTDRLRANLSIGAGSYMNANYAAETATFKNVVEANAGIKISKTRNIWIDAGIFSSHIGFESAVSKDCWTLTRSLLAENSPYYEAGAKITYISNNNKWLLSGLVLNGWQRIQRVDGNSLMSFGTQVQYKPSASTTINYSTFIGTDKPDSARLMRYFHNVYGIFNISQKLSATAGFDIGMEQQSKGSSKLNNWYSPVLILKYLINDQWSVAARGEYYHDEKGVVISSGTANGFQTAGYSFNIDYLPLPNVAIRLEARSLHSKDALFLKNDTATQNNSFITSSIAISF